MLWQRTHVCYTGEIMEDVEKWKMMAADIEGQSRCEHNVCHDECEEVNGEIVADNCQ